MKTLSALALATLMVVTASASSFAGDKKNTAQIQATTTNQQVSIKHLRLRLRAHQTPPSTLLVYQ